MDVFYSLKCLECDYNFVNKEMSNCLKCESEEVETIYVEVFENE